MRVRSQSPIASPYLGYVSVVTAASAFGYAWILGQQGNWTAIESRQAFVLTLLIAFAIVSTIGAFARPVAVRAAAAAACAGGLLPLGFLAVFSIGLVLIVAGALAFVAWLTATSPDPRPRTLAASTASAMAAIAILAVGLAATG